LPAPQEAGEARVLLALNGQQFEAGAELGFRYTPSPLLGACVVC